LAILGAAAPAALAALESFLLAVDTPPAGDGAQPPSLGALVAAGAGFLGLVILFIMIVVHKRSRKHKVVEREAAEPEPDEVEPSEMNEAEDAPQ
jgi:hypothetical protein